LAALYWLAMVVSMLYVKHSFNVHKDLNTWDKTVYLNATAAIPLAFMVGRCKLNPVITRVEAPAFIFPVN
jgi:hypothetical protein